MAAMKRPSHLRLVGPHGGSDYFEALGFEHELTILVTIPRRQRLLREIRNRLGGNLRLHCVTPQSLTFAINAR